MNKQYVRHGLYHPSVYDSIPRTVGKSTNSRGGGSYQALRTPINSRSWAPTMNVNMWDATTKFGLTAQFYQGMQSTYAPAPIDKVFFIPYGDPAQGAASNGLLIAYDCTKAFGDPASFTGSDLKALSGNSLLQGFGAGFFSPTFDYLYLIPSRKVVSNAWQTNTLACRINMLKYLANPQDPTMIETFDIATMSSPPPTFGFFGGMMCGGRTFFMPTFDNTQGGFNNYLVSWNSTGNAFTDPTKWSAFDLSQGGTLNMNGIQSCCFDGRYLYIPPFGPSNNGSAPFNDIFVRFDTTLGFLNNASYARFHTTPLAATLPRCITGACYVANRWVVLAAWKDDGMPDPNGGSISDWQGNLLSTHICYDTLSPFGFTDARSYQTFDSSILSQGFGTIPAGYEGCVSDNYGLVWFLPTGIYTPPTHYTLPILIWNSALPFSDPLSWTVLQDPFYNPNNQTATHTQLLPGGCGWSYDTTRDIFYYQSNMDSKAPWMPQLIPASRGVLTQVIPQRKGTPS